MACLNPKFKTSEASTKAWFRSKGLIDKYLNITDTDGFRKANQKWSKDAQTRYSVQGMLFAEENNKAYPNKEVFKKIDKSKGITYEQRDSQAEEITYQEFEQQRLKLEKVFGITVEFDDSIDGAGQAQGNKVLVNPNKLFRDTLVHEVAHIFIDSMGGLENPMIQRGLAQLKGTALEGRIKQRYQDQSEEIIQKEILATAIGLEGALIFGERPDRISKFKRWLDLFFIKSKMQYNDGREKMHGGKKY